MTLKITITDSEINQLDLSKVETAIHPLLTEGKLEDWEQKIQFEINFTREENDPRELSEIPEIRLWYVKLDAKYPWFPLILDWKSGELARYTAMLVPHQFHRNEGIQYNPEALEIFVMQKIFGLSNWLKERQILGVFRLKSMAQMLGYDIEDSFLELIVKS
jgi:hypothetical protein